MAETYWRKVCKSDGSITIKIQVRLLKQKYQAEEEQDELYVNAPSECGREGVKEAGNSSLFKGRPAEGMPKRSQICCVSQPQQRPPCLTRFAGPWPFSALGCRRCGKRQRHGCEVCLLLRSLGPSGGHSRLIWLASPSNQPQGARHP